MQTPANATGGPSVLTPIGGSYYVVSKSLRPEHYQQLMDRGWRRSGSLLYLPDAARSCCPHYTIRLPASEFQPSRDQRQALNRWNRFILGDEYIRRASVLYPKSKQAKQRAHNAFDLRTAVHESEESTLKSGLDPDHRFIVTLEHDDFTEEKYALFENYQQNVHHEGPGETSRPGFKRFLCSSPLQRVRLPSAKQLGSFHQCYRLDGRLIAIGVLDLLPHAVSGVYFIYHREFEKWSMGKLSALREGALAGEGGHANYYMGYYIHSCDKMRYKGSYRQQYVLDYRGFTWDPLDDEMRRLMEAKKYVSMSAERRRKRRNISGSDAHADDDDDDDDDNDQDGRTADAPDEHHDAASVDDAYEQVQLSTPLEAASSGRSLLELGMPGVMSLPDLRSNVDLDRMSISLGRGRDHRMEDIVSWHDGSELDTASVKGVAAELAACVGPGVAREVVLDFSRNGCMAETFRRSAQRTVPTSVALQPTSKSVSGLASLRHGLAGFRVIYKSMSQPVAEFEEACESLQRAWQRAETRLGWESCEVKIEHGSRCLRIKRTLEAPGDQHGPRLAGGAADEIDEDWEEDVEALATSSVGPRPSIVSYDIVHSASYQVPVLYITFEDDAPPSLEDVYRTLVPQTSRSQMEPVGIVGALSMTDHPMTGLPAYFVHPCRTQEAMCAVRHAQRCSPEEYLMLWLGLMGGSAGLHVPIEVGRAIQTEAQRKALKDEGSE